MLSILSRSVMIFNMIMIIDVTHLFFEEPFVIFVQIGMFFFPVLKELVVLLQFKFCPFALLLVSLFSLLEVVGVSSAFTLVPFIQHYFSRLMGISVPANSFGRVPEFVVEQHRDSLQLLYQRRQWVNDWI